VEKESHQVCLLFVQNAQGNFSEPHWFENKLEISQALYKTSDTSYSQSGWKY